MKPVNQKYRDDISTRSDEDLVKEAYQRGYRYEAEYGNCAQCVLLAVQETLGLVDDQSFKSATGLAGGVGLTGESACGALTGGVMAIGLKYGREIGNLEDPKKTRFKAYRLAKRLYYRFLEEYGSSKCSDIQTKIFGRRFNLWDPDDYRAFEEAGGHRDKCPSVVGKAAGWVIKLILDEEKRAK